MEVCKKYQENRMRWKQRCAGLERRCAEQERRRRERETISV